MTWIRFDGRDYQVPSQPDASDSRGFVVRPSRYAIARGSRKRCVAKRTPHRRREPATDAAREPVPHAPRPDCRHCPAAARFGAVSAL
ncbi:hypothetical protein GCM10009853_070180 [Glycomyces scopariae]